MINASLPETRGSEEEVWSLADIRWDPHEARTFFCFGSCSVLRNLKQSE